MIIYEICKGAKKVSSTCAICDSKGIITLRESWAACPRCGNHRCLACGGTGLAPVALLDLNHPTST